MKKKKIEIARSKWKKKNKKNIEHFQLYNVHITLILPHQEKIN